MSDLPGADAVAVAWRWTPKTGSQMVRLKAFTRHSLASSLAVENH